MSFSMPVVKTRNRVNNGTINNMSNNEVWAKCGNCGKELKQSDKQCPKCGSTRKAYKRESRVGIVVKPTAQWVKTHTELKINWKVVTLIWIITFVWLTITSFLITGWLAFLLSIPVSLLIFFFGIYMIARIIEKTRSS